jgi:hypothetical protein
MNGGREGIRTPDPLLAKQVLSQLSYTPALGTAIHSKVLCVFLLVLIAEARPRLAYMIR